MSSQVLELRIGRTPVVVTSQPEPSRERRGTEFATGAAHGTHGTRATLGDWDGVLKRPWESHSDFVFTMISHPGVKDG